MRSKPPCAIGIASAISAGQARRGALAAGGGLFFFFLCLHSPSRCAFLNKKKRKLFAEPRRRAGRRARWLRLPYPKWQWAIFKRIPQTAAKP